MMTAQETDLNFEREILLHVFDHQYEERQLDSKSFIGVGWACNVRHTAKTTLHHLHPVMTNSHRPDTTQLVRRVVSRRMV